MRYVSWLLLFTMALMRLSVEAKDSIRIRSKIVRRDDSQLTLAHLLPNDDGGRSLASIFKRYPIGNSPKEKETRQLSNLLISSLIRQVHKQNPHLAEKYNFVIPSEIEVLNPGKTLTDFEVREALLNQWKSQCPNCRIEIHELNLPRLSELVNLTAGWQFVGVPDLPKGSFSAAIQFENRSGISPERVRYWVNGVARLFKQVPILTRGLSFGETITADHIKIEYHDVTFARDLVLSGESVLGRKVRLTKAMGQVLFEHDLLKEKAVNRGDWVKVTAQEGKMEVTTMARAENEGFIGDVVLLRVGANKQSISGIAKAKGEVILK
ncbi:MAG: flagellar basal body P-ring formation protein FlgA [Bdellovibrionales bacterium]|nr:flagellar basal body P-ring formation protein FlgA [Bdellovibrionales bacterium]